MMSYKLRMNGLQYATLHTHLFPGDSNEAIAFAICGIHVHDEEQVFLVHHVEVFAYEKCERRPDLIIWSPTDIVHLLEECRINNLYLLKIHCHPGGWYPQFSDLDDESDIQLSETLAGWVNRDDSFVSVVMLPGGSMIGRVVNSNGAFVELKSILVADDDIKFFIPEYVRGDEEHNSYIENDAQLRTRQAFGEGTVNQLNNLKIAVIGCSGTGSIVAELLGRLGVGELVLVDPDIVEFKNLNRILNARYCDAAKGAYKVDVLKDAIETSGTNVAVTAIAKDLHDFEAFNIVASCDIAFGCMDSVDGRHLLNRISTFYQIPYFDLGIRLDADGKGGIDEVMGRVDFIKPGGSSLLSRERYSLSALRAADLARTNPKEYESQVREKYIRSVKVDSPAVISVNMYFASQSVTELLARLHMFRTEKNERFASVTFSIAGFLLERENDGIPDFELSKYVGRGRMRPLLNSPLLIVNKLSKL